MYQIPLESYLQPHSLPNLQQSSGVSTYAIVLAVVGGGGALLFGIGMCYRRTRQAHLPAAQRFEFISRSPKVKNLVSTGS